jgi:hypothetical protein
MIRNSLILVASFGLLAGCATSSANSTPQNPDAGKVDYDVGGASGGGSGSTPPASDGGAAPSTSKGRDSTGTKAVGYKPKAVKKIAAAKPPKTEEPVDPKAKPTRTGRVIPNGLLAESFTIDATVTKLPDFTTFTAANSLFIAPSLDATSTSPLTGAPAALKAPVALRFTGSLNVVTGEEYKLCTRSTDGSQLLIEDTLVVDNDGVHAEAVEVCELVNLEPGEYKFEVRSFHVTGPVLIQASWAVGKEGTPASIPTKSLFKPEGADARVKAKK